MGSLQIVPRLPTYGTAGEYSPELDALAGAVIVRVGAPDTAKIRPESGGFGIEYRRHGSERTETILFGFSELGLWIER